MPTATANGKKFNFPEGTTPEQIGQAIDEFFSSQQAKEVPLSQKTEIPTEDNPQGLDTSSLPQDFQSTTKNRSLLGEAADFAGSAIADAGKRVIGVGEGALSLGTSALGNVAAGLTGLGDLALGVDPHQAAENIKQNQQALTYEPGLTEGQQVLEAASTLIEPVAAGVNLAGQAFGDAVKDVTGSNALAAIGSAAPAAALEAVGLKGLRKPVVEKSIPQETLDTINAAKTEGIPVLTTDLSPPKTFTGKALEQTAEKIPFVGTGSVRQVQQQARTEAVQKVIDKYGEFSYSNIVDSLKSKTNKSKRAAGEVLQATGDTLDGIGEIPLKSTRASIERAQKELGKKGVIQSSKAIDDLKTLIEALESPQTFTTLKENRTAFREIVDSVDPASRSPLMSRPKTMLRLVEKAMSKDMEVFAKANLADADFTKWKSANNAWREEATKLTSQKIKAILDKGDVTPEIVENMLFSRRPSEVKQLYSNLTKEGRINGRSAIISKVVDNLSKRQSGVTPNSFSTEMRKFAPHISTFFKGEDLRQLKGLQKVLESTRRAQDASVSTPTGQQLIPLVTGAGLATQTGATVLAGGSLAYLARIYNSPAVRSALLEVDSSPLGSSRQKQAIDKAYLAFATAFEQERQLQAETEGLQ